MNQQLPKADEPRFGRKPPPPVIDVFPTMNLGGVIAVALRLTALNFFLRIVIEISTPLLVFAGIYQRSPDDAPAAIGWVLVGVLIFGAILLWALALPVARFVARGLPFELNFGDLTLADCYSIAFVGIGLFYIVGHLPDVWNWTAFVVQSTIHGPHYPWSDRTRGYQIANAFIPFIAGIILVLKRRKWALKLAGSSTHNAVISPPWSKNKTSEPIPISIDSPPR